MGFKARKRAYRVGDVVALKIEVGYWTPPDGWVRTGYRTIYQTILEVRKHGDVPHSGEPEARFGLDGASCEEIQPRISWRAESEFELAIPKAAG